MTVRDYTPAPEPSQEPLDDPDQPDWVVEGRCEWCLAYLPHSGRCHCPDAQRDAKAEGAWLRYEEDKER